MAIRISQAEAFQILTISSPEEFQGKLGEISTAEGVTVKDIAVAILAAFELEQVLDDGEDEVA